MRPYVIGGACHRVQNQLDLAMQGGVLELPADLAAHVERCPHCGGQAREVEALFRRLRSLPAGFDVGPVPGIVDKVLALTAADLLAQPSATSFPRTQAQQQPWMQAGTLKPYTAAPQSDQWRKSRPTRWRWVLGQVGAVAAVIVVAAAGLTYLSLVVNHAVSGVKPAEVVQKWVAPLQDWTQALFH